MNHGRLAASAPPEPGKQGMQGWLAGISALAVGFENARAQITDGLEFLQRQYICLTCEKSLPDFPILCAQSQPHIPQNLKANPHIIFHLSVRLSIADPSAMFAHQKQNLLDRAKASYG